MGCMWESSKRLPRARSDFEENVGLGGGGPDRFLRVFPHYYSEKGGNEQFASASKCGKSQVEDTLWDEREGPRVSVSKPGRRQLTSGRGEHLKRSGREPTRKE